VALEGRKQLMSCATNLKGKEVIGMTNEKTERSRRVAAIKETAKSTNGGRSYLLKGLWACRLAAGLDQRQLAEAMGSSQRTVGQLERGDRGAYPKTIMRLCAALGVAPEDLLSDGDPERTEARR
jgi:DNA-binding Xre family transcriptional regulator